MTLGETEQVFAYWVEHPPVYLMVEAIARMLGWRPAEPAAPSLDDLSAMAPPGLAVGGLGMPSPVFEVEALRERNRARLSNGRPSG